MTSDTCTPWDPSSCEGTTGCPPRCPRFVDKHGAVLLVEPVTDATIDGIVDLYEDYPDEHRSMGLPPVTTRRIEDWVERLHGNGVSFVARDGDRVVGHAAYAPETAAVPGFVVFVDPDMHDRGIGSELCRQVIAYAADAGHEALKLDVDAANERAVHVYKRMGFRVVDREGGDLMMRLPFDEPIVDAVRLPPAKR